MNILKIAEMQGLWDIAQVMLQRRIWPMGRSLGYECMCPGPANCVIYSGERNDCIRSQYGICYSVFRKVHQETHADQ